MSIIKSKEFWIGALIGYGLVVLFPQFNVRTKAVKTGP